MISKWWDYWKNVRDNDPVKARLARVLFGFGVVVVPFLFSWAYWGFSAAMGMILTLIASGLALLILVAGINYLCGGLAQYVFTGSFPDPDDLFKDTVLDQWEKNQNRKSATGYPAFKSANTKDHLSKQRPKAAPQVPAPNLSISDLNSAEETTESNGPEWLKNK